MVKMLLLATQGSAGTDSYAENSSIQNYNFHCFAKPRLRQAIQHLLSTLPASKEAADDCTHLQHADGILLPRPLPHPRFAIVDLGCSHGRNTLDWAEFILLTLMRADLEIQYFFSDLPSNDFNALFQSLQPYLHGSSSIASPAHGPARPKVFAAGVPGSFYNRLFPSKSLHLVICSFSLHWLSQVPPSLVDKRSPAWNGGHTWISNAGLSNKDVIDAYAQQSKIDLKSFLKNRAHELISGGILFLLSQARTPKEYIPTHDHHQSGFMSIDSMMDAVFDCAWKELVAEGLITSEEMDMFNIPMYKFNQQELEEALKDVPELVVLHMETMENVALFPKQGNWMQTVEQFIGMVSSILRPTLNAHMGKHKADELFMRFKIIGLKQNVANPLITHTLLIASLLRS